MVEECRSHAFNLARELAKPPESDGELAIAELERMVSAAEAATEALNPSPDGRDRGGSPQQAAQAR